MIIISGLSFLFINIGYYIDECKDSKRIVRNMEKEQKNKRCENCKYWIKDDGEYAYNDNFGYCCCRKIAYREDLYKELGTDLDKKEYDNYYAIYSDSEGLSAELKVHKEFGCICFRKNKRKRKEVNS